MFEQSKIGDGATIHGYSDSHACTIVAISEKKITLQHDTAELLNGANSDAEDKLQFAAGGFCGHTSGNQRWETTPNPEGGRETYSLRKNNRWARVGLKAHEGRSISEGRSHHYDFNF